MSCVRIEDLNEENMDDLIGICSPLCPQSRELAMGVRIRREWLREMLLKHGSVAKMAYLEGTPVAQLTFYPETADPTIAGAREGAVYLQCVYNPGKGSQRKGIAKALMENFIDQCGRGVGLCKGCKFIVADAFDTGEALPLPDFYRKFGFVESDEPTTWGGKAMLLPVLADYTPPPRAHLSFVPLDEDRGRALVFYWPTCQFSYSFASKAARMISEVGPDTKITLMDAWKQPYEYLKRGARWAVVNSHEIRSGPVDPEAFKREVRSALRT